MRVAAIVPAYNEEQTIGEVLEVLLQCPILSEIHVVSDGSEDRTVQIAKKYPVNVFELPENMGKGGAMKKGAHLTSCEVLLFIDADLVGLHCDHIEAILRPVLTGETQMSIGVFSEGRLSTDLAQKIAPSLSGQRAITKGLFEQVPNLEDSRFGVEIALTRYAEQHGITIVAVPLPAVSQVMKEKKRGFAKGFWARIKMYWDIVRSIVVAKQE